MDGTIDVTKLTTEQLEAALALKKGRVAIDGQKCSFVPKRSDQSECKDAPCVQYGEQLYCAKHKRSVQALKAKKQWEEANTVPSEPTPEETKSELPVVSSSVSTDAVEAVSIENKVEELPPAPAASETPVPKVTSSKTAPEPVEEKVVSLAEALTKEPSKPKKGAKAVAKKAAEPPMRKRVITPNKWGRFEDLETGIIFDPRTKAAYGVQDHSTGKVKALTPAHIKICEKYKWKYHVIKSAPVPEPESSEDTSDVSNEDASGGASEEESNEGSDEEREEEEQDDEDEDEEELEEVEDDDEDEEDLEEVEEEEEEEQDEDEDEEDLEEVEEEEQDNDEDEDDEDEEDQEDDEDQDEEQEDESDEYE